MACFSGRLTSEEAWPQVARQRDSLPPLLDSDLGPDVYQPISLKRPAASAKHAGSKHVEIKSLQAKSVRAKTKTHADTCNLGTMEAKEEIRNQLVKRAKVKAKAKAVKTGGSRKLASQPKAAALPEPSASPEQESDSEVPVAKKPATCSFVDGNKTLEAPVEKKKYGCPRCRWVVSGCSTCLLLN